MFGPNVAKAMGLLGELLRATVILYEAAPGYLVHLRITVLDVAEKMDTWISDENDARSTDHYTTCLLYLNRHSPTCEFYFAISGLSVFKT